MKSRRNLCGAVSVLWLSLAASAACMRAADGGEIALEKSGDGIRFRIDGAWDAAVLPIGPNLWAVVWAEDSPPKLVTIYVRVDPSPSPPGPAPGPTLPEAGRLAREWLKTVPEAARGRSSALAEAFRRTAEEIDAGKWKTPAEIIAAAVEANRAAVGEARNDWLAWFEALRQYMNGLAERGGLKTPAEHAALFRDLAEGLR